MFWLPIFTYQKIAEFYNMATQMSSDCVLGSGHEILYEFLLYLEVWPWQLVNWKTLDQLDRSWCFDQPTSKLVN